MDTTTPTQGFMKAAQDGWNGLDRRYRTAFLVAFGVGVFTYFLFFAHHLLGNHAFRVPWLHENEQIGNGRWLGPWVGYLHYDADVPVVMQALGLFFGLWAAWLALRTWGLVERGGEIALLFTFIIVFPFNLAHFYYTFITPLFFISWLFAAAAIAVVDRASPVRIAIGAVLVMLMMASYQTALSVLAVIVVGSAIAGLIRPSGKAPSARDTVLQTAKLFAVRLLATAIGGVLYFVSLRFFAVNASRTPEITSLGDLIDRVLHVIELAFTHLWISQPDMIPPVKIALLALFAAAVVASLLRTWRSPVRAGLVLVLWFGLVVATKALFLVSEPDSGDFEYRYNTSLIFFHAFTLAVLLNVFDRGWLNRATALAVVILCGVFIQADLVRQHVLLRGQQHDLAIANRILNRMETLPDLQPGRTYDLIRIGHYSRYRWNLYRSGDWRIDRAGDGHMDFGEITDRWVDEDVFRLLGSSIPFQQSSTDPRFALKAQEVIDSGVLNGRQPWPAPSSVFIDGDRIIVYMQRPPAPPAPPAPQAPMVEPADGRVFEDSSLDAVLEPERWRSISGGPATLLVTAEGVAFSASQAGISTDALRVAPGDRIRQVFTGRVIEPGDPANGLPFPVGPLILGQDGRVVGWWSSGAGAEAAANVGPDGQFEAERVITVPDNGTVAHLAFHGPWLRDHPSLPGRILIESSRLERVDEDL